MPPALPGNSFAAILVIARPGCNQSRALPGTGGCLFVEDPSLDARQARPLWCVGQRPIVRLIPHTHLASQTFDLWAVPGRKSLCRDDQNLWLHGESGRELVTMLLSPDLGDGAPFAYALPAGAQHRRYRFQLESALALLQRETVSLPKALSRPSLKAITYMRALQALDGTQAGISQRQIAVPLFGRERVAAQWGPDSEVRAQVRYLIERGEALMEGGYRDLLE